MTMDQSNPLPNVRFLIIKLADSELSIDETSDDIGPWELIGIAAWLDAIAEPDLVQEEESDD